MKVLFVTSHGDDYISSCLWDGLQEVLGLDNVYNALGTQSFQYLPKPTNPCNRISSHRQSFIIGQLPKWSADIMVVNACFLRDYDWRTVIELRDVYLKNNGKVAFVEGWDGCACDINKPEIHVDAVFRREIDPNVTYPYDCQPMLMAAPSRWFRESEDREIDVFYACAVISSGYRWDVCRYIYQTKYQHRSIVCSRGLEFEGYFDRLACSKLAICPVGAAECADCLRTYEVVSQGAIPVFVGYPPRVRKPWFTDDEIFVAETPDKLPGVIDKALSTDLSHYRRRLRANAIENHTTAARAKQLLTALGVQI